MEKINLSDFGFRRLQIETKAACNMACSFCPYPLKEDKVSTLDLNEIQKVINQINPEDKNFQYITFHQFNFRPCPAHPRYCLLITKQSLSTF